MKKVLIGCAETIPCLHGSPGRGRDSVMSCQSLTCDADPLQNFHRTVHFSLDNERKSMEYLGDDTSDNSGTWGLSWTSQAMSRSAPASCPAPMSSGPMSLESTASAPGVRFPRLEECAHFHYGRVQLGRLCVRCVQTDTHSAHEDQDQDNLGWVTISVRPHYETGDQTHLSNDTQNQILHKDNDSDISEWMVTRSAENLKMLDNMLHSCIYDRKVSGLPDLSVAINEKCLEDRASYESLIGNYLDRFSRIADDTINCGPILNWFQMDNKGHKLLVATEDCNSINTPAVAAAYSVRRYVSQARDEISFEVGDMISVIDMPGPSESTWWRGKRGFRVGFFPQQCVAVIGDKVPRNMKQPPPIVGSVSVAPIKPVLRKHGKLISLFRSFILSRPSRRSLRQQGILKERVFGCDLGEHLLNSGYDVPQVLTWCASIIEEHGRVDGIYRLSGASSATQRLRFAFDEERPPSNPPSPLDVHAVASLLKMYFRELPNPLCTFQLYSCFVSAVKLTNAEDGSEIRRLDEREKLDRMRETVVKLPPPHYRTLAFLMRHLYKMSLLGNSTGMTARNMGIVWAPNLLRSPLQEFSLSGVAIQVVVTEFLICYANLIFSDDQQPLPEVSEIRDSNESPDSMEGQTSTLCRRPKSLPLATPTRLLSLEEAKNKQQLRPSSTKEPQYIEVGGGPNSLPQYHTIIHLRPEKRGLKRSPSGWRGLFFRASKHRTSPASTPPTISKPQEPKVIKSSDVTQEINKTEERTPQNMTVDPIIETTRSSRSCESFASEADNLPPLTIPKVAKLDTSHNRSASCDSYFEHYIEIDQMRLSLTSQEREMDIFSEDDTTRQVWNKDESSSGDTTAEPSPIKLPRTVQRSSSPPNIKYSPPDSKSSFELQERLSNILYIDCSTPEHTASNNMRSKTEDATNCTNKQNKSSDNYYERNRYLTVNQTSMENDSSTTYVAGNTHFPSNIKMRERSSPRKTPKTNLSRHSHCGPPAPSKFDLTPHRHSTLIRVDWLESDNLRDPNPDLCGYTQLQSDSDTSLQITESKDSLAKRLIESKESLLSTTVEENFNVIDNCLQLESKPQLERVIIDNKKNSFHSQNSCEGVTETFTGIITKRASRENLDASIPSHSVGKLYESNKLNLNCAKSVTDANFDDFSRISNGLDQTESDTAKADKITSGMSTSISENKITCVFETSIKNTDVDNENRYNITVTPNDDCTHTIADSLESSLSPTNISYQNLNRLSMISGDSGKAGLSKESTPTYSSHEQERTEEIYECFNFSKPSYIHLASSSGGSSPTSPQNKSPLKSTINITYKSPTKEPIQYLKNNLISHDETVEDKIYEDVANAENNPPFPGVSDSRDKTPIVTKTTFADLVMQDCRPALIENNAKSESNIDSDIYNKVKFFRQSVHEVNSLIMESDNGQQSDSPCDDSLDINKESNKLGANDEYEIVDYNTMLPSKRHNYENVDVKNNIGKSNSNSEGLTPLTELCLDRRLLENQSNIEKVDHAYENFDVKTSIDQIIHRSNKTDNALKLNLENKTFLNVVGESDKENSDENENIAPSSNDYTNKRSSVKQLAHKFESPTENKGPFFFDRSSRNNLSSSEKIKEGSLYSFDRNKAVSFCEGRAKMNMTGRTVPCIRVKNNRLAKNSNNARSLDENAFVKEFGNQILHKEHISEMQINDPNTICNRRKSLEALKSLNQPKKLPDLNLNTECNRKCFNKSDLHLPLTTCHSEGFLKGVDSNYENRIASITPTTENKICLVQARFSPKKNKTKQFSTMKSESSSDFQNKSSENIPCDGLLDDDKKGQLSRERIEKYKEERRLILREKYSSQSFRGINDLPLTARVKDSKMDDEEFEGVQLRNPGKLERRNTADAVQRSKYSSARIVPKQKDITSDLPHMYVKTVAEIDGINENFLDNIPSRIGNIISNADKPRITGMQRKFSLDGASLYKNQDPKICITDPDNIGIKNVERPKTLNTFGISTSIAISEQKCLPGMSKDEPSSSITKKEKRSPSFNIKDMAAKFEQKSLNNQL